MTRLVSLAFLCLLVPVCGSWGFAVHRHINAAAVDALPAPLYGWFLPHRDWLFEHAVDADKRKHMVKREPPKHYVDLDAPAFSCLDTLGPAPWFDRARCACKEDTLWAYGVLPWSIQWGYSRLVAAMDTGSAEAILRAASDLGHYAADAHVPLHTTVNYNGQWTGQDGIHALWETRLPERYGSEYMLVVSPPELLHDVGSWAWHTVRQSHAAVDSVLDFEKALVDGWHGDLMVREKRGRTMALQRVPAWCDAYHDALDGMVERRWRASIHGVASLWTSAWVSAGQPDLSRVLLPRTGRRFPWIKSVRKGREFGSD